MTQNSRFGGQRIYEDRTFPCRECGTWFKLTIAEQKVFDNIGLPWPKKCPVCRERNVHQSAKR